VSEETDKCRIARFCVLFAQVSCSIIMFTSKLITDLENLDNRFLALLNCHFRNCISPLVTNDDSHNK